MINNYEFFNDCVYIMSALKKFGVDKICVAGGCIRDTLLGKPVKDIDVFCSGELMLDDSSDLAKHFGIKWNTEEDFVEGKDYEDSKITVMNKCLLFEDIPYPVQIILCDNIMETVNKFPCGLSKAVLDDEGGLSLWPDFLQSEYFKIISYSVETPAKYKMKLQKKYPEFSHE